MKKLFGFLLMMMTAPQAYACSVCFGDPNSLQSKALTGAVTLLLMTIGAILFGIAFTAFTWSRRAKKLERAAASSAPLA